MCLKIDIVWQLALVFVIFMKLVFAIIVYPKPEMVIVRVYSQCIHSCIALHMANSSYIKVTSITKPQAKGKVKRLKLSEVVSSHKSNHFS